MEEGYGGKEIGKRSYVAGATELGGPGGPWPPHLLENGLPPVTDWRTLPIKGLDD